MADSFSLAGAEILALFFESLFFGVFVVLYSITAWLLLRRDKRRSSDTSGAKIRFLIATSTVMLLLAIAHLGISIARAFIGFVVHRHEPDGAENYYARFSDPTFVVSKSLYVAQTLIGDSFLTYRLYVVWGYNIWITILPGMLTLATGIVGSIANYRIGSRPGDLFASDVAPWITAIFACSLSTNVLATSLIAARIVWSSMRIRRLSAGATATNSWSILETVVQSAAIYSAALTLQLGLFVANSNAQLAWVDAIQPLIGITFALIILRVGRGDPRHPDYGSASTRGADSSGAMQMRNFRVRNKEAPTPLAITVTVDRHDDRGSFDHGHKDAPLGPVTADSERTGPRKSGETL